MAQNNIVELNGRQYDAATGALLGQSLIKATPASRASLNQQHHGRVVDGFIRKRHMQQQVALAPKPASKAKPAVFKSGKQFDVARAPAKPVNAHQPERPKTLMRTVVHKPKIAMKPAIKMTAPAELMAKPASSLAKQLEKKLSVTQVDPVRLGRSKHVAKSQHIQRFRRAGAAVSRTAFVRPLHYANQSPARTNPVHTGMPQAAVIATKPAPSANQTVDVFEAALAHAVSHEQAPPRHAPRHTARRRRFINAIAGISAFLLIGGFVAYLNVPNIELRVASMHAGFSAVLPGYKPEGYALSGGIKGSYGRVSMSFRSGDSSYTITQTPSDWNSQTLLDQTTAERGRPTQTIETAGRTIYTYNGANAVWVNGGIRYQITSNTSLTTDELTALATSM